MGTLSLFMQSTRPQHPVQTHINRSILPRLGRPAFQPRQKPIHPNWQACLGSGAALPTIYRVNDIWEHHPYRAFVLAAGSDLLRVVLPSAASDLLKAWLQFN